MIVIIFSVNHEELKKFNTNDLIESELLRNYPVGSYISVKEK